MKGKMKAAVLESVKNFQVKSIDIPEIGPKDILVRVTKAGVCGSDLPIYTKGFFVKSLPFIIGHEFASIVEEIGSEVEGDIKVGDRVTGFNALMCGECFWCKRGEYDLCPVATQLGLGFGTQGCFAEYTVLRNAVVGATVLKIPENLDDYEGASIEPMAVGIGNVNYAGVKDTDKVIIVGAGIVGQSHLQMAKLLGATVAVVDISQMRLDMAKKMGADIIINPKVVGDPVEYVIDLWGNGPIHWTPGDRVGGMADVVIECTGLPEPFTQCFRMVRPGGTVQIAGTAKQEAPVDPRNISLKKIRTIDGLRGDVGLSVKLLSEGKIRAKELITHTFKLDDIEAAFAMQQRPEESVKVMLDITD